MARLLWRRLRQLLWLWLGMLPGLAQAGTYAPRSDTYTWESTANAVTWARACTSYPVDDDQAMARAILESLATLPDRERLRQRGREFSLEPAVAGYHRIFFGEPPASFTEERADDSSARPTSYAIRQANGSQRITHSSRGRVTI